MKKVCSLILLLLINLSVQAQIQRNIWGLQLGRSTKAEVKSFLASNHLEYEENFSGYNAIGITDIRELSFGGFSWSANFIFYNNILFHIQMIRTPLGFSMTTGETYEIDTKSIFNELKRKLNNKYGNLEIVKTNYTEPNFAVRDNNTCIELILTDDNSVILKYVDRRLARMNQNGDDL